MAKNNDPVSNQELLLSLTFQLSAIINILEKQKILTKDDIYNEVIEMRKKLDDNAKLN